MFSLNILSYLTTTDALPTAFAGRAVADSTLPGRLSCRTGDICRNHDRGSTERASVVQIPNVIGYQQAPLLCYRGPG